MHINIAWQDVDIVPPGMDGTLLDLALDDYFQQKLVPETRGAKDGVTLQGATECMRQQYHDVQHALGWYCLDYWGEQLGLNICTMTTEMGPCAVLREDTIPFLEVLKASDKQRTPFANVYPHNLAVKLEHTGLDAHLDLLFSTRTFGYSKEDQRLWHVVAEATDLRAERTLFIDNSETVFNAVA